MEHHYTPMEEPKINYHNINKECVCFNMRRVSRAVTQYYDRILESTGIRITQYTLLVAFANSSGNTLTEIAESLLMDRTTLTRNLKPLEKAGYITSVKTVDKRSKNYVLTEAGKEILKKAVPLWKQAQETIINALTEEGYQDLKGELNKVISITSSNNK